MRKVSEQKFLEILAEVAPGTQLREAIEAIRELGNGGLIVIADEQKANSIVQAGFKLDAPLTPQKLTELSKMDRAIVVSEDLKRIIYANAYLVPDPQIPSEETGTRHLTAEKVAKQLNTAVIAISAASGRVTVYWDSQKYALQDISTLSSRVNQALRILEQYRATFDELSRELTALEFEGRVLPFHVANIIQNIVQMLDTEEEIRRWFVELGEEKDFMELLLEWLMLDVKESFELIIRDFQANGKSSKLLMKRIRSLPTEDLLSSEKVMSILGYEPSEESLDTVIPSRGYRVLSEIPRLPMSIIERLVKAFGTLERIMEADEHQLMEIKGIAEVRARAIKSGLKRLARSLTLLER